MTSLFPVSLDNFTDPTPTSKTNSPSLSGGQTEQNQAIEALEAKLGTGASTPTSGTVLRGNGVGSSQWADVDLTTDVTGTLPIANGGTGATSAATARTALGLEIGTNVQAFDADLSAVAGLSSSGIITRTGAGTASARTITGTSNAITVTNGDGVSGNPTLNLSSTIALAGKTITNTGTLTLPTSTDTLVGRATTDTLTNKTLTSPIISGTGGTTAAQYGYDATDKAIFIGDGTTKQSIYISAWKSYTPTYGGNGSMTYGTVTTNYAKYCIVGRMVTVAIYASGTVGGTPNNRLTATLPITAATTVDTGIGGGWTSDGGGGFTAMVLLHSSTAVGVQRYDASAYTAGAGRVISITFTYEI